MPKARSSTRETDRVAENCKSISFSQNVAPTGAEENINLLYSCQYHPCHHNLYLRAAICLERETDEVNATTSLHQR